ncbi:hypothetical protein [Anaeromyxobacter terrae]|uniref:hypothetical protein n=1 Tax=Anaeromyxobacter terrae TaxID=2925406 RepID=UPI001F56929B|nr:hypothetical protein [Anaeromyxobacter sp. SG22]
MTTVDDAALELLRSRSGLSIDDEGRFLHLGEPITHARTLDVLWRSLSRAPDGRWLVRVGRESAYVEVRETPYTVRGVLPDAPAGALALLLSDGTREPLDPATLSVGDDGVLRCAVKGEERARFTRAGQVALGFAIDEDPPGTGRYAITIGGTRWPIRTGQR